MTTDPVRVRAVTYARYSTDNQREQSIEDQQRNTRAYIEKQGWQLVGEYSDAAVSGATTARPGHQHMLRDAEAKRFDVIVVDDSSRLGRELADFLLLVRKLKGLGIRAIGISDGYDSFAKTAKMQAVMFGFVNDAYREGIRDKVRRGLTGNIKKGLSAGGSLYGYRNVPIEDPTEKDEYGRPVIVAVRKEIDPEQAAWVLKAFTWYGIDGLSSREIVKRLNAAGVPSPRGGTWSFSAIYGDAKRGIGFLNQELYRGRIVYNRSTFESVYDDPANPGRKRRKRIERPESEWTTHDVPELRIVPEDIWNAVKARQQRTFARSAELRKAGKHGAGGAPRFILSGIIKCTCGANYVIAGPNSYLCANNRNKGTCSNSRRVPRVPLEQAILGALARDLFIREHLQAFRERAEAFKAERKRQERAARQRMKDIDGEIANLISALKMGIVTPTVKAELLALEEEKARLEARPGDIEEEELLPLVEQWRRRLGQLEADQVAKLRSMISSITAGVVLVEPSADGSTRVRLRGSWMGLYSVLGRLPPESGFTDFSKLESRELPAKLELVAPGGFEPPTQGL
jgi:site-specific DNA recombinase